MYYNTWDTNSTGLGAIPFLPGMDPKESSKGFDFGPLLQSLPGIATSAATIFAATRKPAAPAKAPSLTAAQLQQLQRASLQPSTGSAAGNGLGIDNKTLLIGGGLLALLLVMKK